MDRYREWLILDGETLDVIETQHIPLALISLGYGAPDPQTTPIDQHRALEKLQRFLYQEQTQGKPPQPHAYDLAKHTQGLPEWLIEKLEQYRLVAQRNYEKSSFRDNWRPNRWCSNVQQYWSAHLHVWKYLCLEGGVTQLNELTAQHLNAFVDARIAAGRTPSTINAAIGHVRSFLVYLQEEGYPVPSSLLVFPGVKRADSLPRAISDEHMRSLRDGIEEQLHKAAFFDQRRTALLLRAAFYLLWQCGLRLGEVEGLRLNDLDFREGLLIVCGGKGMKDRIVYLSDTAACSLQDYLRVRGLGGSCHVFLHQRAPLKQDFLRKRLNALAKPLGIKVKIHSLRHTCATQLLNAGCRITSIQALLGHTRLDTTMIYARVHDKTVERDYFRAMKKIEQMQTQATDQ